MTLALFAAAGVGYGANTYYVWTNSPSEGAPYDGWNNAAHAIQTALNSSASNDTVLVTNGVYDAGTTLAPGPNLLKNRVCVTNAVTLRSVNGPEFTIIKGAPDGVTGSNGDAAVRCVYLTNSASLIGFTLTNGYTMTNGDSIFDTGAGGVVLFANTVVSNCVISGNMALYSAGAVLYYGGTMNNCTLSGNRALGTAGAYLYYGGTMNNCTLSVNVATTVNAGGASLSYGGTMSNCMLSGNSSPANGGGVYFLGAGGTMNYCTFSNNYAGSQGGGAYCNQNGIFNNSLLVGNRTSGDGGGAYLYRRDATMNNCKLTGNMSTNNGGGVFIERQYVSSSAQCLLKNCLFIGNQSRNTAANIGGGGAYLSQGGTLSNCTFYGNTAVNVGGGMYLVSGVNGTGAVNNCIIWGNNNDSSSNIFIAAGSTATVNYTCSGPVQTGTGNIGGDPFFVDTNTANYRLTAGSPCVNAGANSAWMTGAKDLDGRSRIDRFNGRVDMGAYEWVYNGMIYRIP